MMVKIWGKLIKNNKIIKQAVASSDIHDTYQENLTECIVELCYGFDIGKPYWLTKNADEYNKRYKTTFNADNFIESIEFDKFIIEALEE